MIAVAGLLILCIIFGIIIGFGEIRVIDLLKIVVPPAAVGAALWTNWNWNPKL